MTWFFKYIELHEHCLILQFDEVLCFGNKKAGNAGLGEINTWDVIASRESLRMNDSSYRALTILLFPAYSVLNLVKRKYLHLFNVEVSDDVIAKLL
jgi:hypothetical protein